MLIDADVAGALDHVDTSTLDRGSTYIVGAVAKALGHDISTLTLSRSSIKRSRFKNREEAGYVDKELISNGLLLLHWDEKLLLDIIDSKETVDRVAALVTGSGKEILLGVPKTPSNISS